MLVPAVIQIFLKVTFIYLRWVELCACAGTLMWQSGQLVKVGAVLPLCGSWGLGPQQLGLVTSAFVLWPTVL